MKRLCLTLALLTVSAGLLRGQAVETEHVTAELVAARAALVPGEPAQLGLRLVHDPKWHTYWRNPGIGYPTALAWDLPEGWTASDIAWPVPARVQDTQGNVTGFGYEDETFLLVTVTPPATLAADAEVTLRATAEWLMCKDICIPGQAELSLTLPVAAAGTTPAPGPWAEALAATRDRLPVKTVPWNATAERGANAITLRLDPTGDPRATGEPYFFPFDEQVPFDGDQRWTREGASWIGTLPIAAYAADDATALAGVVYAPEGWDAAGHPAWEIRAAYDATPAAATSHSILAILGLAFLGGLILNLMPCVFPVIGIKIMGFVNQAGEDRWRVTLHGLTFAAGVLVSFWVLAGLLIGLRTGGEELGWGFQLQSPWFVFALTVLLFVFALNMAGLFEIGTSAVGVGAELQGKGGLTGSFFSGVLATVVATPCSAPFLAPALGVALALDPLTSLLVFTVIALGLASPYLLLSLFPGAIRHLPRPGAWMETFKQAMSFLLFATVAWLVWTLAGQVSETGFLLTLLGLVVLALAGWVYGRFGSRAKSRPRQLGAYACAALIAVLALWIGHPRAPGDFWQPWSPETVARLTDDGRIVYVDFTARWCATCQTNKAAVFSSDRVLETFAENDIVALKADWTNRDPRITAALARYDRSAVPFNLIYAPGREEPIILPEVLTPGIVLDALAPVTND